MKLQERELRYRALEKQISDLIPTAEERPLKAEEREVEVLWLDLRKQVPDRVYRRYVQSGLGQVAQRIKGEFEQAFQASFHAALEDRLRRLSRMFDNS